MTPEAYVTRVIDGVGDLLTPSGPRRRTGKDSEFDAALPLVREGATWLAGAMRTGSVRDPLFYAYEFSLEVTSFLYAAGAGHDAWREWSRLASWGATLRGDLLEAVAYAVLGGDWRSLEGSEVTVEHGTLAGAAIWKLAIDRELPLGGFEEADELDEEWLDLVDGITRRDHGRTEKSLAYLAEFWMLEDEGWDTYEPRGYPCFDPYVCAAAALARYGGYRPRRLTEDARRFLDPGLAPQHPDPFTPPGAPGGTDRSA